MDTEFVFDTTDINSPLTLVIDEHRQTATVSSSFFRTCQYEVDIRVTVSKEAFYTVQQPAAVFFAVSRFQHDRLKVGACIRFRQVHRHCFALADAGDETAVLVGITEFV